MEVQVKTSRDNDTPQTEKEEITGKSHAGIQEEARPLLKHCKREVKNILKWIKYLYQKQRNQVWINLNQDQFDIFMSNIAPTLSRHKDKSEINKFQSNIKLDVKLYPTFDGKIKEWLEFKRGVLSLAAT